MKEEKEFILSEKIRNVSEKHIIRKGGIDIIDVIDFKEFIRRLKKIIDDCPSDNFWKDKETPVAISIIHRNIYLKGRIDGLIGEKLYPNFKTKKQHNTDSNKSKKT